MMDGDGSIQVNHWRKKSLQFRLIIKLKYTCNNEKMLNIFKDYIGGNVRISVTKKPNTHSERSVLWVENDKKKILKICEIFKKYPLLTFNKNAQLYFLYRYIHTELYSSIHEKIYSLQSSNSFENFLVLRKNKYTDFSLYVAKQKLLSSEIPSKESNLCKTRKTNASENKPYTFILKSIVQNFTVNSEQISKYDYFPAWVSGFTEAEGCFAFRQSTYHSFSLSQKSDAFLLKAIAIFFDLQKVNIRKLKNDFYLFEIYKKASLLHIISHFHRNPLLGQKKVSYEKLKTRFTPLLLSLPYNETTNS